MSIESNHKRIIDPVWSSTNNHDPFISTNMWPIRQQSHLRRFYGLPKSRVSHETDQQLHFEVAPIKAKSDVDQYNDKQAQCSMAFCSTSKVKYMPLHGFSQDTFNHMKWSAPGHGAFPVLSRPVSRPVILHGKRYTILAVEPERSCTCLSFNTKEEDKSSTRTERISEQRRRFNETEHNKYNTRSYKSNTETSLYRIQRNYCLSGHRMFIKSAKENIDERINRLQPILNFQNMVKKKDFKNAGNKKSNEIENHSQPLETVQHNYDSEPTPFNDKKDSIISVDIVSGIKEETGSPSKSSILNDKIQRAIENCKNIEIKNESLEKTHEWLKNVLMNHVEEVQNMSLNTHILDHNEMEDSWTFILPNELNIEESEEPKLLFEKRIGILSSNEEDSETFLMKMFEIPTEEEQMKYWSKILSLLNIHSINASLFSKITLLISIFQQKPEVSTEVLLARLYFWLQLFRTLFNFGETLFSDLDSYLRILVKITVNRNLLNEDLEKCLQEQIRDFCIGNLLKDDVKEVETLPLSSLIDTIPWIFSTHLELFRRKLSMDDLASAMSTMATTFGK